MKSRKSVVGAIVLSSAVGLASSAVWSQQAPRESQRTNPDLTRPGDENPPGAKQKGTPELSKSDMRKVEEALQVKGYKVGKIDGMADDDARKAISAFQKDNGLSITGTVDERTADKLGVRISSKSGKSQDRPTSGPKSNEPKSATEPSDQNQPSGGTRRY
jgi:peptidoglycan hydrolase-like protein with peptidoglycan-binding domain